VLMLEDCQRGKRFPEERTVIIDKDLCVFWCAWLNWRLFTPRSNL
jgi:hypothetical protein